MQGIKAGKRNLRIYMEKQKAEWSAFCFLLSYGDSIERRKKNRPKYRRWAVLYKVSKKVYIQYEKIASDCRCGSPCQDAHNELGRIECPTLVMGGDCDQVVGAEATRELVEKIGNSRLIVCEGYGHSAYEEYPGFNARILEFFNGERSAEQ